MDILISKNNNNNERVFLIPSKNTLDNSKEVLKIVIDYTKKKFVAEVIEVSTIDIEQWRPYGDSTFPTSLFREFMLSINLDTT